MAADSSYEEFYNKYVVRKSPLLFLTYTEEIAAHRYEARDLADAEEYFSERAYKAAASCYIDAFKRSGRYADVAIKGLEATTLAWYEDNGESGVGLINSMYELTCIKELSTDSDEIQIARSNFDSETLYALDYAGNIGKADQAKYWFPQASMGENVARTPAEFRVAVCFEVVDKTVVEGCAYSENPQNPQGVLGSVSRKRATYSVVLINPYTGERFADSPLMPGTEPPQCPSSIVGGGMYEYIGPPDYTEALSWIEANFRVDP